MIDTYIHETGQCLSDGMLSGWWAFIWTSMRQDESNIYTCKGSILSISPSLVSRLNLHCQCFLTSGGCFHAYQRRLLSSVLAFHPR